MSFILDALKKSESDRQRQSGPALYEVKVAAPRSQLPYWAIGLIVLLGINLIIVAWALLRRPSHVPEAQASTQAPAPAAVAPMPASATPAAYSAQNPNYAAPVAPPTAAAIPAGSAQPPGGTVAGSQQPTAARETQTPGAGSARSVSEPQLPPAEDSTRAGNAVAASSGAQDSSGRQAGNPDDYAPATEPSQSSPGLGFHVKRGTVEGVPLYSQVSSGAGIPELRLDMHAYAPNPQNRFVLINMKRLREGDSLPDGTRVESITPDGVVLDHSGTRFLLPRE